MDPISLIVAALVAGATAGAEDFATDTIKDAYTGLKELIKRRFKKSVGGDAVAGDDGSSPSTGAVVAAEAVLEAHESAPETWEKRMREALERSGADHDDEILTAAQTVLDATGDGSQSGKYLVDTRGAQGIYIGDQGHQTNSFGVA